MNPEILNAYDELSCRIAQGTALISTLDAAFSSGEQLEELGSYLELMARAHSEVKTAARELFEVTKKEMEK